MNKWITDRLPTEEDAPWPHRVWVTTGTNFVDVCHWTEVVCGTPWKPMDIPIPYVKPKRWTAEWSVDLWRLVDTRLGRTYFVGLAELGRDGEAAAQRICDIYNEVMP